MQAMLSRVDEAQRDHHEDGDELERDRALELTLEVLKRRNASKTRGGGTRGYSGGSTQGGRVGPLPNRSGEYCACFAFGEMSYTYNSARDGRIAHSFQR